MLKIIIKLQQNIRRKDILNPKLTQPKKKNHINA